jgi:quercetin dioxygenase-like cupin family protein
MAMRLWQQPAGPVDPQPVRRDYETLGYVIEGKAELELEGQTVVLESGDSWLVPKDAVHRYRILEDLVAVESTSPPARVHDRDAK